MAEEFEAGGEHDLLARVAARRPIDAPPWGIRPAPARTSHYWGGTTLGWQPLSEGAVTGRLLKASDLTLAELAEESRYPGLLARPEPDTVSRRLASMIAPTDAEVEA